MTPQFAHLLTSSFLQWFDYTLVNGGQAFSNYGGKFYEMKDDRLANHSVYSLPFGQIVHDSSIAGAQIPSGVYVNGVFTPRGTNGLQIDFQRGRAIFDGGNGGLNVSGDIAIKEFDVSYAIAPEETILLSNTHSLRPKIGFPITGLAGNQLIFPAIFISKLKSDFAPFELGVHANLNTSHYRCLVLAENDWQLDGLDSVFTQQKNAYIPLINTTPFNFYGDLKNSGYNYQQILTDSTPDSLVFIKDVSFTKYSNRVNELVNPLVLMAVIQFTLQTRI